MTMKKSRFTRGIILRADDVAVEGIVGELKVGLTSKELHAYLDGSLRTVATLNQTQTLTNKSIDADTNTIANLEVDNLKTDVLVTSTTLAAASDLNVPSTLAAKTYIDAADANLQTQINTIAADYADDVEGPASSTDNAIVRFDSTTGKLLQNSSVTIDDSGVIGRAAGLVFFASAGDITFTPVVTGQSQFNYAVKHNNSVFRPAHTDSTAGANVSITVGDKSTLVLTSATSVDTLIPYLAYDGQIVTLINGSASPINLNNETGAITGGRIRTGSGTAYTLPSFGSVTLTYSNALSRWSLNGGNTAVIDEATRATAAEALVQSNLTAHINDATDAHAASAITNTPSGNLAATDIQSAVNELQTDIDTRATTTALNAHTSDTANPHAVTKTQVGLGNVDNTSDAAKNAATATLTNKTLTAPVITSPTGIVKADVGLGNVDNTSDAAKPVSTATQTALNAKVTGPGAVADNLVARFDGTTGALIQSSTVTISDSGAVSGVDSLQVNGLSQIARNYTTQYNQEFLDDDATTTGSSALIASGNLTPITRLTNVSLVSIGGINATESGRSVTLINDTGNDIQILNQARVDGFEINTGTGASLTMKNGSSLLFKYNGPGTHWSVIGGTGSSTSGGTTSLDTIFQLTATELLATWSTGDNATFLGGGTLSGTFAYNTTTPLSGIQSYKYTQAAGSLNDYIASPTQAVASRFRGQTVTLDFPYKYDGATNDIEVIFYDATNSAIIPSSVYLENAPTIKVFKTFITIPTTCSSIRVGFKTNVLNSGKILEFADVQLSQGSVFIPQPLSQSSFLNQTATFNNVVITGALSTTNGTGVYSYNSTTGIYTILKACEFQIDVAIRAAGASSVAPYITAAGTTVNSGTSLASASSWVSTSWSGKLSTGDTVSVTNGAAANSDIQRIAVLATATSDQILTAPETFSSDTAAFTYAGSATYTLATLANAPVGTYITYTYAINTNAKTQTTTRPTQTDADMNTNGILITGRAYNVASLATTPATVAIQVGKGLKGKSLEAFGSSGKTLPTSFDLYVVSTTTEYGTFHSYDEKTGILFIDAGLNQSSSIISKHAGIDVINNLSRTAIYVVTNLSKNPALTGMNISTVAARGICSSGQSLSAATTTIITLDAAKTFDTHGALSTTTFTSPENGYYQVNVKLAMNAATQAVGNVAIVFLYKNGTEASRGTFYHQVAASLRAYPSVSELVYLAKGDTLDLRAYSDAATTLIANTLNNTISITKTNVG